MHRRFTFHLATFFLAVALVTAHAATALADATIAKNGKAVASGIYLPAGTEEKSLMRLSAQDMASAFEAMSGAAIEIKEVEKASDIPAGPAVVLGQLAEQLGAAPQNTSLWKDSVRTVAKDGRLLIAGETEEATSNGIMELLHGLGVRYFLPAHIPGDIGTVTPKQATITISGRDSEWHPHIRGRRVWGHNMGHKDAGHGNPTRWLRRNMGNSEVGIPTVHAWHSLVPKSLMKEKPELFAIKRYGPDGEPVRGSQICVSNPEAVDVSVANILKRFDENPDLLAQSISPNDGGGACICHDCQALDPPGYLEPSSGKPAISDRYIYFFNKIAERVAEKYPDRYLAYLVYSDYSRAPIKFTELHPNIVPVFAPIRYPRMQSMHNKNSEQNIRLKNEILAYSEFAKHIGYYGYNYNLAETTIPFSKISIWSQDLPWLYEQGLFECTIETLGNWNSNGPHIYLSSRYIVSGEDPAAIMDDYYSKLGGSAGPALRAYWERVDKAFVEADIHSGSYYGIEQIMTPALMTELQKDLDRAAKAASNDREKAVVAFFQSGLDQGKLLIGVINDLNNFRFTQAKQKHARLQSLNTELEESGVTSHYPNTYMRWFIDHVVESASAIEESGGEIAVKFPSTWKLRLDYYNVGVEEEWFDPTHVNNRWKEVEAWGAPSLYSQGFEDWKGYQWMKVDVDVPAEKAEQMMLWFGAVDGKTRLWVNGEPVTFAYKKKDEVVETLEYPRGWRSFAVPVGKHLKPGEKNNIVIRVDHSLNDLNLGGLLRPVLLYVPGDKEMKEVEDTYQQMLM